ncbi:MAG: GTP 3',8-cyclase MoaA [bacterium]|nr:GTP 3',8-cyclase MoaA [bacterium]
MSVTLEPPRDLLDRPMSDLRISVTDRCNFRCTFCMPSDRAYKFLPKPQILSFEEVTRLARLFVGLGVEKIRLSGGEPLLRSEIEHLVASLVAIDGLKDLALTTNAYLLPRMAESLRRAGLGRVTVSLHSLDAATFGRINGLDLDLERVLAGIRAAVRAGLTPVKLNVVVMQGVNDHEVVDLARFGREQGCVVRFIEYMDVGTVNEWDPEKVVSAQQIVERVDAVFPLEPIAKVRPGDVANRYRYRDGGGELGVITSVTQPFCGDCSRVRLSAEGKLYTCLFAAGGHDLKTPLRDGASDDELLERIRAIWTRRADRYSEERTAALAAGRFVPAEKVEMFRIGG